MQLHKIVATKDGYPVRVRYSTSHRDANAAGTAMAVELKLPRKAVTTEAVEVPTTKVELIEWLNALSRKYDGE